MCLNVSSTLRNTLYLHISILSEQKNPKQQNYCTMNAGFYTLSITRKNKTKYWEKNLIEKAKVKK